MRHALRLLATLPAALLVAGVAPGASPDEEFVHRRMAASGFIPLEEMTFGGRDVRRVLPIDPYGMLPIAGIELERHADGHLTLRAQYRGWAGRAHDVSLAEWTEVAGLEAAAYAPPVASERGPAPTVVVHCWRALMEASPDRAAGWSGCGDGSRPVRPYIEAVLDLAMRKMECPAGDEDTFWRFSACTAAARRLADPALAVALADLRARWDKQREPGATILADARRALRAARADPSETLVAAARDAVFAFGRQQQALRTILSTGFSPLDAAEDRDGASAVIVAEARAAWRQDVDAQDRNYITLLEELARLQANGSGSAR